MAQLAQSIPEYNILIQQAINQICQQNKSVDGLLNIMEDMELNINITINDYSANHYAIFLTAYLIQWDITNARFLWKRIRNDIKNDQNLINIYNTLKAIWNNDFNEIIDKLKTSIVSSINDVMLNNLLQKSLSTTRNHLIKLYAENFSVLSLINFQNLLKLTENEARTVLAQLNWKVDKDNFIQLNEKSLIKDDFKKIQESQMENITKMVAFLDTLQ